VSQQVYLAVGVGGKVVLFGPSTYDISCANTLQRKAYEEGDSGPLTGLEAPLLSPDLPTGVER
jgi:hypothetical protein